MDVSYSIYQVHSFTVKKKRGNDGENKAERDVWHNTVRATDRKVPAREKALKMIIDLATMINPQTRFKKKKQWNNLERKPKVRQKEILKSLKQKSSHSRRF